MSNSKYIRSFIAIAFLAIYVNVLAKNITCNLGPLFSEVENHHSSDQHDHHSKSHSHDEHGAGDHHSHQDDHDHSKPSSKDDGNCCNDETAKIFKSLSTPTEFDYSFKALEFQLLIAFVLNFSSANENTNLAINNYSLPPPKIPDIRVHIQSFQI